MKKALVLFLLWAVPAAAEHGELSVTRETCNFMTVHEPDADVAYQPGVDVHGKPVAPADIGPYARVTVPRDFGIDIQVILSERLGIPTDPSAYRPEAHLGYVEFKDGMLFYEGQQLADLEYHAILEACRKYRDEHPELFGGKRHGE